MRFVRLAGAYTFYNGTIRRLVPASWQNFLTHPNTCSSWAVTLEVPGDIMVTR